MNNVYLAFLPEMLKALCREVETQINLADTATELLCPTARNQQRTQAMSELLLLSKTFSPMLRQVLTNHHKSGNPNTMGIAQTAYCQGMLLAGAVHYKEALSHLNEARKIYQALYPDTYQDTREYVNCELGIQYVERKLQDQVTC